MKRSPYLTVLLSACGVIVALVAAVNWVVDPLRYFHRPWFGIGYSENQRYQAPGLIRHERYDTILLGSSHTEIFTATSMNRYLGGQTLNLSLSGASIVEQSQVLEFALAEGTVRRVLWEINYPSFSTGERLVDAAAFPGFLYHPGAETPFRYLVSWDTFEESLDAIGGRRPPRLDDLHRWDLEFEFGSERVLANWDHMTERWNDSLRATWSLYAVQRADIPRLVGNYVGAVVAAHPGVRFDLLFLPASALEYANDFQVSRDRLAKRLELRRAVGHAVGEAANVVLWDFQLLPELTGDLDRYKDLDHFDQRTAEEILQRMQSGSGQVSGAELIARSDELGLRAAAFAADFCAREADRCQAALLENLESFIAD